MNLCHSITWYDFYNGPSNPGAIWNEAMTWPSDFAERGVAIWRLPATPGITNEGEMGYLGYNELGNTGGLSNKGPFANFQSHAYWSGTERRDLPNLIPIRRRMGSNGLYRAGACGSEPPREEQGGPCVILRHVFIHLYVAKFHKSSHQGFSAG